MSWTPDASELKKPHRSAIKGRRENEKTKTLQSPPTNVFLRATTPGTDHRQLAGAKKLARWVRNTLKKKGHVKYPTKSHYRFRLLCQPRRACSEQTLAGLAAQKENRDDEADGGRKDARSKRKKNKKMWLRKIEVAFSPVQTWLPPLGRLLSSRRSKASKENVQKKIQEYCYFNRFIRYSPLRSPVRFFKYALCRMRKTAHLSVLILLAGSLQVLEDTNHLSPTTHVDCRVLNI